MASNCDHYDIKGAFERGEYDLIIQSIENGGDVNGCCDYFNRDSMYYILYLSTYKNRIDIVRYLVSKGAMINQLSGPLQWTALHVAIYKNHPDIVTFLLDSGIDIDIKDSDGRTAADLAERERCINLAKYIRSYIGDSLVKGVQCDG